MIITNSKRFNDVCKTLADFCTNKYSDKQIIDPRFYNIIRVVNNTLYATEGHILAIVESSDCIENDIDFSFPVTINAKKSIVCTGDTLKIDDKEYHFYQPNSNIERVIPTEKPTAQITFNFSDYKLDRIKYDWKKNPYVKFVNDKVSFHYNDCLFCEIEDCFSNDLLSDDFGDFEMVRFPMWQISQIMKISKKFTIQQFNKGFRNPRKIIAGEYEFVIASLFEYE